MNFFWSYKPTSSTPVITEINYGALYNWYAATDVREIAAVGWHVPTISEIQTLANYLGASGDYSNNIVGGLLKETGEIYWNSPNEGALNTTMFNGRGAGFRSGVYENLKYSCRIWTLSLYFGNSVYFGLANFNQNLKCLSSLWAFKYYGQSIRPIKDSTTLTHGQTGTYTGNDGKIYRTICIGTQEWLADNLAETKYRNGDLIPIVTDNTAWTSLTTGGMCYYNNDINNA